MQPLEAFRTSHPYEAVRRFHQTRSPNPQWVRCRAGLPSALMHIPALVNMQYQTQWCWAASIAMVFARYGFAVQQERIVEDAFGAVVNMPAYPDEILGALTGRWEDELGRPFEVRSGVGWAFVNEIIRDLAHDHPVIVGTRGHAMVLTALEYVRPSRSLHEGSTPLHVAAAVVRDPWPGIGRRILTEEEWRSVDLAARIRVAPLPY